MRKINAEVFKAYCGQPLSEHLGTVPGLAWVPVESLRIDPSYQREVLRNGSRNIGKIAREFDWSLFGIVVVANIGDQLFAIVDGQHRTIAAAIRGIEQVPCVIIDADPGRQAKAFAAINGAVTSINALSIFSAEVRAGDEIAVDISTICARAGVRICKYPVPANKMDLGETLAISAIQDTYKSTGRVILELTLKCLMAASNKRPGLIKANLIKALAHVLEADELFRRHTTRLLEVMSHFDIAVELPAVELEAKRQKRTPLTQLKMRLFEYLDGELNG